MDSILKFRMRRKERLDKRFPVVRDAVADFRIRRQERLDADEGEDNNTPKKNHGNTRLPYGLCQREGIEIGKGWTPKDAWNALEGKGYSPKEEYEGLKEGKPVGSSKKEKEQIENSEESYQKSKKDYEEAKTKLDVIKKKIDEKENEKAKVNSFIHSTEYMLDYYENDLKKKEKYYNIINGRSREEIDKEYDDISKEYDSVFEEYIIAMNESYEAVMGREEWEKLLEEHGGLENYLAELREKLYGDKSLNRRKTELYDTLNYMIRYGRDAGYAKAKETLETKRNEIEKNKADKDKIDNEIRNLRTEYENEKNSSSGIREKYRNSVISKYKTYDDCKTKDEILERFNVEEYFRDNGTLSVSENYNIDILRSTAKSFSSMIEKIPEMKGRVGKLTICPFSGKKENRWYGYSSSKGVFLNDKYYSDPEKMKKSYDHCVKVKFHPEGTTYDTIVIHEYCHQLDTMLSNKLSIKGKSGRTIDFSTQVMKEVKKRTGLNMDDIKRKVSTYSYDNDSGGHVEFFAEAMSEYLTSENPREIAVMVGEITKKYLKQAYGGTV